MDANNRRIAKNTLLLYVRMLFTMAISLYTSRVVLHVLGVTDYGVYNVVGGVITLLGFLTNSMSGASSRYITFSLGKGDMGEMRRTFGNILSIHFLLAGVVLLLGETIGLWFVLEKLRIPADRMDAALWVYHLSVLTAMLGVVSVPYNAAIIAHERMRAFAYIGIVDALLKLVIVYLLWVMPYDKLVIYALLLFGVQVFDRIVYGWYCVRHFEETRARFLFDKRLFREMFAYAAWTMNGNLAVVGYTQGINILLNLFYGPVVNAARGIATQVQTVAQSFCSNFQTALNPQLTKSYARGDLLRMHQLLTQSSKFSFFILWLIALPLMLEAPLVLRWWLGIVPEHTENFLRLILCASMLSTLSNPLIVSVHATGNLKRFQLIEGTMLLSIVPIAYLLLKLFGIRPEYVFCVHIAVELCTQYARMRIVLPMIAMRVSHYAREVVWPIVKVVLVAPVIPLMVYLLLRQSVASFLLVCTVSVLSLCLAVYCLGCSRSERESLKVMALAKITRRTNSEN